MTQSRAGVAVDQSPRTPKAASSFAGGDIRALMWLKKSFNPGVAAKRPPIFQKVAETHWSLQPGQPESREVEKDEFVWGAGELCSDHSPACGASSELLFLPLQTGGTRRSCPHHGLRGRMWAGTQPGERG